MPVDQGEAIMPYRHAHYWLLLLFPLTLLAFWPGYFSTLGAAPFAHHLHGVTGTAWTLLIAVQSWAIHSRRNALHRRIGLGSFLLFPLFTVGGLMVIQVMAQKAVANENPFSAAFGPGLGTLDSLSTIGVAWLFFLALKNRRKVQVHARCMIATVFFLFAPIFARLLITWFPPLAVTGPDSLDRFVPALHISNAFGVALALFLYMRGRQHGWPFLIVAWMILLQSLCFETLGKTEAWRTLFAAIGAMPTPTLAAIGLTASAAVVWFGWTSVPPARRPAPATTG